MPDTFCCRSTSLKISRNTLTGSRTLHELGEREIKHGVRLSVVNLYTEELGTAGKAEGGAWGCCCAKKTGRIAMAVISRGESTWRARRHQFSSLSL